MSNFWFWLNLLAGVANLVVYYGAASPKWYTVACIAISFFCAGVCLCEED